tara:strand:- start:248 stop:1267 length:1020 start_codon:yes stop_codon:yes gene_type:complete
MNNDLTIILLIKDRHEFNERFFQFYNFCLNRYNLIIADGGNKKIENNKIKNFIKNKKVKYIKFVEDKTYEIFYKKIYSSLKKVKTKFVLFAANDDFIVYENLNKSLKFLKKNKEFIGCGGIMMDFRITNKSGKKIISNLHEKYSYIKLDHTHKLNRFNSFIKNLNDLPRNCIIKKKILLEAYAHSNKMFGNNVEFKDNFTSIFNVISGKIKIFKSPLILHQSHFNTEGGRGAQRQLLIFNNYNFIRDIISFDKFLSKKLNVKQNYVIQKYYQHVLIKFIREMNFYSEPSIIELRDLLKKKIRRKFNNNLSNRVNNYLNLNKIEKNTVETIKFIEQKILN